MLLKQLLQVIQREELEGFLKEMVQTVTVCRPLDEEIFWYILKLKGLKCPALGRGTQEGRAEQRRGFTSRV